MFELSILYTLLYDGRTQSIWFWSFDRSFWNGLHGFPQLKRSVMYICRWLSQCISEIPIAIETRIAMPLDDMRPTYQSALFKDFYENASPASPIIFTFHNHRWGIAPLGVIVVACNLTWHLDHSALVSVLSMLTESTWIATHNKVQVGIPRGMCAGQISNRKSTSIYKGPPR